MASGFLVRARGARWASKLALLATIAFVTAVCSLAAPLARGQAKGPVLHEPIPPDPHEDIAMQVALDGDLPAAIETKSGVVHAPDPRRPVAPSDSAYGNEPPSERTSDATFRPDRNTKRPDIQGYDEPFTPSTAPFKRLEAFDAISETYELFVRDKKLVPVPIGVAPAAPDASEEQFFADLVVDVSPARKVRIPSVGPGARIVRARLGVGADDMPVRVWKDGAENWFLESLASAAKARLVMQLAIARGAWGSDFADTGWEQMPRVAPLPMNVQKSAAEVQSAIGVSRALRPRENIVRLVRWFRSFAESEQPPTGRGDIYLDLALSKKGVCRHRAFAFMVTAQSLGIPARMVINEAHAWVEAHDGVMWRRIDLGGAGRMVNPASSVVPERAVYQAPPDAFAWPQGSERGDDMVEAARQKAREMEQQKSMSGQPGGKGSSVGPSPSMEPSPNASGAPTAAGSADDGKTPPPSASSSSSQIAPGGDKDDRPSSSVTVTLGDADAHRGAPLHVRGVVTADGEPCAHVMVELYLRDAKGRLLLLGTVATGDAGEYAGAIVVPGSTPLGDYDVLARTQGDARCGSGAGP